MSYLRDNGYSMNRRDKAGWKKPAVFAVAVVALYIWGSGVFADMFFFISYPFSRFFGSTSNNFSDFLFTRKSLISENSRLSAENSALKVENQSLIALRLENEQLRGFKVSNERTMTPAKVIVKPGHLPYDEIIIDIGTGGNPSLQNGKLVFADRRVILGQIEQVGKNSSKVKLYSEGGVSLPVGVGEGGTPSVALGVGNGNFTLTLPRGVDIKVGDSISTTIIGNYLLGYVGKIIKDPNDPFQKILFRSPYNIFSLNWVLVSND